MKETVNTLVCIGGPMHGKRLDSDRNAVKIAHLIDDLPKPFAKPKSEAVEIAHSLYHRREIAGEERVFTFWLHETMTLDEFFVAMFVNIQGGKDGRP